MPSLASKLTISSSSAPEGVFTAATVSAMPWVCSISFNDSRTEVGDPASISSASARAPSTAVPAGATLLTRPRR